MSTFLLFRLSHSHSHARTHAHTHTHTHTHSGKTLNAIPPALTYNYTVLLTTRFGKTSLVESARIKGAPACN